MEKLKIYLTGRDNVNWATDDDFKFTKSALLSFAEIVDDTAEADVIHSVNWHSLLPIDKGVLKNKIVVAHIPHDVRNMLMQPEYLKVAPFVDRWIVPSKKAKEYADLLGLNAVVVPYGINFDTFHFLDKKIELRKKYNLPEDKYIIGSFQRDTEGSDLKTPKYVKGPDIFLAIVKRVFEKNKNIHVVLAGPRRFWLRNKLKEFGIPHTFVGQDIVGKDDLTNNTLGHETINELYNSIDLYIVSSRLEGGPKAILECAATRTKIISTDVGQASDILNEKQVYTDFLEAAEIVGGDIRYNILAGFIEDNYQKSKEHGLTNIAERCMNCYASLSNGKNINKYFREIKKRKPSFWERVLTFGKWNRSLTIFFKFHKGPWGGGNQFLAALSGAMKRKGFVIRNSINANTKGLLFNSFHIDFEKMKTFENTRQVMIHRIDGPTFLIRDKDKELDDNIFEVNNKIADVSIFQSVWSLLETFRLGYRPINPVIIRNASDPKIFNRNGKIFFSKDRKIRLISSSWSDNPRKGGPIYKWLDDNLDWDKYEYTFVGRLSEKLQNIRVVEPVYSDGLASLLKQHDIYITASDNDPCSNALIEALSCGLPAIYLNRGGHPELVSSGGIGFSVKEEILTVLDKLVENYQQYQDLIVAPDLSTAADKYVECLDCFR
ncbi:MAG: glycosyltransferase [Patescibacteria group bacterium]